MPWFVAVVALLVTALAAVPATAASPKQADDVWVGQVARHSRHFDYRGSPCPATAEVCVKVLANLRIVPLNPRAAVNLRRVAGGQAKLIGYRGPAGSSAHDGTLYVRRVQRN